MILHQLVKTMPRILGNLGKVGRKIKKNHFLTFKIKHLIYFSHKNFKSTDIDI